MRHRERAIELVEVCLLQIEKGEEQIAEVAWTIRFYFEPDGITTTGTPQFLFDCAKQIFRFFFVDVEIAVAGDAEGAHTVEDEAGEKFADVMFDEPRQVDGIPGLISAFETRH